MPAPPSEQVHTFHRGLPGYAPTPLRPLPAVAAALGVAGVWVKDESDRLGMPAFKVLGASWAVEQALAQHPDVTTVLAASAGNHGRAVARYAVQRGLTSRIYLPAAASPARKAAIAAEGATVVEVAGDYDAAVAAAARAADAPGTVLVADVAQTPDVPSPGWVTDGYATLFRELADQLPAPADVLLVPMGVGSLAAAAVRWAVHEATGHRGPAVVGVEPTTAACVTASLLAGRPVTVAAPGTAMAGMDCATPSAVAWPTLAAGLTGTVTVADPEVFAAMRELAGYGLAIGDCGAAPLAALRALAHAPDAAALRAAVGWGPDTHVVWVATEGPTDPEAYQRIVGD